MHIKWASNSNYASLSCASNAECYSVTLPQTISSSTGSINCDSEKECGSAIINCPDDCTIHCTTNCAWDADSVDSCSPCFDSVMNCPTNGDCTIICEGEEACINSIFYGPQNGNFTVECGGDSSPRYACAFTTIHAENSSYFVFAASGDLHAATDVTIYLPPKLGNQKRAKIFGANAMKQDIGDYPPDGRHLFRIYAINGWLDFDIDTVYYPTHGIMHCNSGYQDSCAFTAEYNEDWECLSSNTICDFATTTTSPTKYPSKDPSKTPTTYPSKSPSESPNKTPSTSPSKPTTGDPSSIPTSVSPSDNPTMTAGDLSPTVDPVATSNEPSISPTIIPSITSDPITSTNHSESDSPTSKTPLTIIIISIVTLAAIIVIMVLYCGYKKRNQVRINHKASINLQERLNNRENNDNNLLQIENKDCSDSDPEPNLIVEDEDLIDRDEIDKVPEMIEGDEDHQKVEYLNWNHQDIYEWIMSLRNGLFIGYQDQLQQALNEENVRGSHLNTIDKSDIKGWGIVDYEHRQTLFDEIKQLVRPQQIEGGDTEYL